MSYGIIPYSVRLRDINICYGNNLEAKEAILNASIGLQNELDERFPPEEGWEKSYDLLEGFLEGKWNIGEENTSKHWYIVEILIKGYGKQLNNEYWYPASIDNFYNYAEFQMFLISLKNTFRLPSPDSFPTVFTILNKDLRKTQSYIENDCENAHQKEEFLSWIDETAHNNQDLVLYYY